VGLANTLKLEGAKYNIKVNVVAPLAATRLTEDVLPPDLLERLKPEYVTPLVLYLCSEGCPVSGGIYNAGMGFYNRAAVVSGPGVMLGEAEGLPTPEKIAANWKGILSLQAAREYPDANAALMDMLTGPREAPGTVEEEPAEQPAGGAGEGSVAAVFETMGDHFQAGAAAGVDVVFQFDISGPGGGAWHVVVKEGACQVASGAHDKPTTTLAMSDEDFLQYVSGQLPAMQAYTSGRLKITGDLMKSQLIEKLFKF
jgi:putative sterol carrier protein